MSRIITTEFERISVESILNIDSKYRKYWVVSDRDVDAQKHLVIISYIGNNETMSEVYISQYRGYVIDILNKVIVAKSFGMPETTNFDLVLDNHSKNRLPTDLIILKGKEGVSLRVFQYLNKTYISTHRKLNYQSSIYRPGITFSEMFKQYDTNETLLQTIENHLTQNDEIVYLYLCHPMLAVADTSNQDFGIFFFCTQSRMKNFEVSFDFPDFLKETVVKQQEKLLFEQASQFVSSNDIYDRNATSLLLISNGKTQVCMSKAFEFRKSLFGEEQTLYPSFVKRVFELKQSNNKNVIGSNKYYNNTDFYQRVKPADMSYSDFIYQVYCDICPDSLIHLLKMEDLTLSEKYSKDYKDTFNWIRKNPDSIIEHCKENRVSVYLAKMRKTQNFLKLEEYVLKNCTPEKMYTLITDYKKAKHMVEKIEKEKNAEINSNL